MKQDFETSEETVLVKSTQNTHPCTSLNTTVFHPESLLRLEGYRLQQLKHDHWYKNTT